MCVCVCLFIRNFDAKYIGNISDLGGSCATATGSLREGANGATIGDIDYVT